jgi:hypothetical protein
MAADSVGVKTPNMMDWRRTIGQDGAVYDP